MCYKGVFLLEALFSLSQKCVLLENQNAFQKMPLYPFDQQPCDVVCYVVIPAKYLQGACQYIGVYKADTCVTS